MKYFIRFALVCAIVLAGVPLVAAQQPASPVIRLGDWVEVGNEVFMNIIATTDIRYRTVKNYDFEDRIQDRVSSRDNANTVPMAGESDLMTAQTRFGVDMRYQKSLQLEVMFEQRSIFDGNLIDNGRGTSAGCSGATCPQQAPGATPWPNPGPEQNTVNIERFWIDYKFPGTLFRMRAGADLWRTDLAGIVGDDDPRFAVFYDGNPFTAYAAAVMQLESSRLGLTNDNDYVYYTFGGAFSTKPHRFAIDVAWFRDRYSGAMGQPVVQLGQKQDTVLVSPSWQGSFGPINAMVQGSFQFGNVQGSNATGNPDLDVWSWAAIGYIEADLGVVTPFVAVIYGTGDSDPFDNELNGFSLPHQEISLISGHPFFDTMDTSTSWGERATAAPARAVYAGSDQFRHPVGNPFSARIGNTAHVNAFGVPVANTPLSNPGVLMPMAGIKTTPVKGHDVDLWWIWTLLDQTETLRMAALQAGVPAGLARFDQNLTHEFSLVYSWTLNPHFDIRLTGNIVIPQPGAKDIANTIDCNLGVPGIQSCTGNDVAVRGEARFRARF